MWSGVGQIVAAGIAESGGDDTCMTWMVVLRALGLELRGENLGQTRVVMPSNGVVVLHRYLVDGIARICLD